MLYVHIFFQFIELLGDRGYRKMSKILNQENLMFEFKIKTNNRLFWAKTDLRLYIENKKIT